MIRFIKNISLFLIPFLIGIVFVFSSPHNKEYGYSFRNNVDCNTSWIYYRLFQNSTPIDIAFMGTSHTGCGINDSLIESILINNLSEDVKVANLAYCTIGRNIQLPLVKDLLNTKSPSIIVMEVTEDESRSSHQDFAYIADLNDVLQPELIYNQSVIKDIYSSFFSRLNFSREHLKKTLELSPPINFKSDYSYTPFRFTADENLLMQHKKGQTDRYKKNSSKFLREFKVSYPKKYIQRIASLAKKNGVKVIFLYLPSYGSQLQTPLEYDFYKNYGEVLIPPSSILINPKNWVDGEHLNYKGSKELANWLASEVISAQ
jgi:hypothetical protein